MTAAQQAQALGWMAALGAAAGLCYDLLGRLRRGRMRIRGREKAEMFMGFTSESTPDSPAIILFYCNRFFPGWKAFF